MRRPFGMESHGTGNSLDALDAHNRLGDVFHDFVGDIFLNSRLVFEGQMAALAFFRSRRVSLSEAAFHTIRAVYRPFPRWSEERASEAFGGQATLVPPSDRHVLPVYDGDPPTSPQAPR